MAIFRKGLNWLHCVFSVIALLASLALILDQLLNDKPYFFSEGFVYTVSFFFWLILLFIMYILFYVFYIELRQAEKREWQDLVKKHS